MSATGEQVGLDVSEVQGQMTVILEDKHLLTCTTNTQGMSGLGDNCIFLHIIICVM